MDLGKMVVDKDLLDRDGRRGGKVDDLLLELPEPGERDRRAEPEVVAIISGPMAATVNWPRWACWIVRQIYHALGVTDPQPVFIPWRDVSSIDVAVHLNVGRDEMGLNVLADAVCRRIIRHLPGA